MALRRRKRFWHWCLLLRNWVCCLCRRRCRAKYSFAQSGAIEWLVTVIVVVRRNLKLDMLNFRQQGVVVKVVKETQQGVVEMQGTQQWLWKQVVVEEICGSL